jgi:GAF domain-containing protein
LEPLPQDGELAPAQDQGLTSSGEDHLETPAASDDDRVRLAKRILLTGAIFGILDILFYVVVAIQNETPRMLLAVTGIPIGLLFVALANRAVNARDFASAGRWMMAAVAISFGVGEFNTSGTLLPNATAGSLLIVLVGNVMMPRRVRTWLSVALIYLAYIFLINYIEPFPRYPITIESPVIYVFVFGIAFLLTIAILFQVVRALRVSAIQTRLLIAFAGLTLLLTVTTSAISAWRISESGREQLFAQLESVAVLKEAEINVWANTLEGDLAALLADQAVTQHVRILLAGYAEGLGEGFVYTRDAIQRRFIQPVQQTERFAEVFLITLAGDVALSTEPESEGVNYVDQTFFQGGLQEAGAHVILGGEEAWIAIVQPVTNVQGQTIGILAGRATLDTLNEIMLERAGMGETGETYLLGSSQERLTELIQGDTLSHVTTRGANLAAGLASTAPGVHVTGFGAYDNYRDEPVLGAFRWIEGLDVILMAEQARTEALGATTETLGISVGVALASVVFAVVASLFVTRGIVNPLANLSETVAQIQRGDLERVARVERDDEIGALARAFNSLTAQRRRLITELEQRVEERTMALERRSVQLEAAAQVAREAAAIREIDELLDHTVRLISDRFGFYHAGIFLLDDLGEYAVLRAASSMGGQRMLERRHSLRLGSGIVGTSAATGNPHIALDVGADATFFNNPDLPETRSEMGLPLKVRERIIGVLDVQSVEEAAFSEDDVAILQTMADQVALAIDNARLLEDSQRALKELETLYGQRVRETWRERVVQEISAYLYDRVSVTPVAERGAPEGATIPATSEPTILLEEDGHRLVSPIRLRGQLLGSIVLRREPQQAPWSSEDAAMVQEVSTQVALALENAQLLEESQRHSERDRLIAGITARVRSSMHMETILQTAVRELGAALGTDRAVVQLTGLPEEIVSTDSDGDGNGSAASDIESSE